jgi:hypothetical protein
MICYYLSEGLMRNGWCGEFDYRERFLNKISREIKMNNEM